MPSEEFIDCLETREELVYIAKVAEQAERYEDMVSAMKKLAFMTDRTELSIEERNLLSVAFKNVVGARRAAWRILNSIEHKEEMKSKGNPDKSRLQKVIKYREDVEKELGAICSELELLIEDQLLPTAGDAESQVFYLKMAGDYYRYKAEFEHGEDKETASQNALSLYEKAYTKAQSLSCTSPIRLGLALNFSVFYYEILSKPETACDLAKTAFDEAIAQLDDLAEANYKDATLIMQLLRDNLALWTSEPGASDTEDDH